MSPSRRYDFIAIGCSAGGVEALNRILRHIPKGYSVPVGIVIHMSRHGGSTIANLFRSHCHVPVREVEDKEPIEAGVIYFAAPDYHLLVEDKTTFALSQDEPVFFSRPSIDLFFESAAHIFGRRMVAILLTGANADGAEGMRWVGEAGGTCIVQDPDTAEFSEMPEAGLAAFPQARVLKLEQLASWLEEAS